MTRAPRNRTLQTTVNSDLAIKVRETAADKGLETSAYIRMVLIEHFKKLEA